MNFFLDNKDLEFTLRNLDLAEVARLREDDYKNAEKFENAPENFEDALDNYFRALKVIGEIAAERIAVPAVTRRAGLGCRAGIPQTGNYVAIIKDKGTVQFLVGNHTDTAGGGQLHGGMAGLNAAGGQDLHHRVGGANQHLCFGAKSELRGGLGRDCACNFVRIA